MVPRAAYIHVPFCAHHCGYCDFAVVAGRDDLMDAYLQALQREMGPEQEEIDTLFLGGGTPSHLPMPQLKKLLDILRERFTLNPDHEFSIEVNPDSLTDEKLHLLQEYGVNRMSIGAQSFHTRTLAVLERRHISEEVPRVVELARSFMHSISLDLMFGAPGQTLFQWQMDLERALALPINHLSTYGLTYEKGTRLWKSVREGLILPLTEEDERRMYDLAMDWLYEAGWEHYEISSFATVGHRCRHNQAYWINLPFYGFGLGAARHLNFIREVNTRSIDGYIKKCMAGDSPTQQREAHTPESYARETATLNLRRKEGIIRRMFRDQTEIDIDDIAHDVIRRFVMQGLLEDDGSSVRLTKEGKFLADTVCSAFVSAI
ncbi:MAG: radical SAM family heme chaperone HemW [Planctomycetia bacterium]|nr:radical SAM family heme chaperone HemW [Planctomycetia bacterium]